MKSATIYLNSNKRKVSKFLSNEMHLYKHYHIRSFKSLAFKLLELLRNYRR